jgi:hypothetical protein
MLRARPYTMGFLIGLAIFAFPIYLICHRSPPIKVTDFHLMPEVVRPGQRVEAVWTVESLREGCSGTVQRRMIDNENQVFAFIPVPTVRHGPVGKVETFRTPWMIPIGIANGPAVLQRHIERWCNFLQEMLWPMQEDYETRFTVNRALR